MQNNIQHLPTDPSSIFFVIGMPVLLLLISFAVGTVLFFVLGGRPDSAGLGGQHQH